MRWRDQRQSDNVEDRRGMGGRGVAVGGGGIGLLILAIAINLCGGDPSQPLQTGPAPESVQPSETASNKPVAKDENRQFVGAIMGNLEDAWRQILPTQGYVITDYIKHV